MEIDIFPKRKRVNCMLTSVSFSYLVAKTRNVKKFYGTITLMLCGKTKIMP